MPDVGGGKIQNRKNAVYIKYKKEPPRKNASGIGLSLSRYLIQLNNGTIELKSIVDKETQFSLIFD